jgi:site-specific DNA-methyltransferase (adenine-specific)
MLCESTEHIIWAVNETKKNAKNWTFNYKQLKELNGGVQMRNMWDIPSTPTSEKKHGKHPSQKPIGLINRLVTGGSNKNDMIIDPFMGSGTLPVVAIMTGRKFIGIDDNEQYCNLALKRIRDYQNRQRLNL